MRNNKSNKESNMITMSNNKVKDGQLNDTITELVELIVKCIDKDTTSFGISLMITTGINELGIPVDNLDIIEKKVHHAIDVSR